MQLAAFRDRVLSKIKIDLQAGSNPTGRYTDRAGNTLECVFDRPDTINGKAVDYSKWPVLESPWTKQAAPAGTLQVTDGKRTRTYDFRKLDPQGFKRRATIEPVLKLGVVD